MLKSQLGLEYTLCQSYLDLKLHFFTFMPLFYNWPLISLWACSFTLLEYVKYTGGQQNIG